MINNFLLKFKEKSPKQRFLLVIGILFLSLYLVLGVGVLFWEFFSNQPFPLVMEYRFRVAFGVLLLIYAAFRFYRFIDSMEE